MVDYYAVLLRAVTAPDAGDARWRHALYDRARQMLGTQLRTKHPAAPMADIAAEQANLEAAIQRIESELSWTERDKTADAQTTSQDTPNIESKSDISAGSWAEPKRVPAATARPLRGAAWIALTVVVAALGAGAYIFLGETSQKAAPSEAAAAKGGAKTAAPSRHIATLKDGDLPPGVDGGSTDADLSYVFRRQPTFYRTLQPVGTIIVDKLQHFLYLIQPNNVAIRYGIGLGERCINLAGLHRIASKAEWPASDNLPGGPGNPLGARELNLDDGQSNIHGTNAPKTIGTSVTAGCIRLVNDDIVDLYNRVKVATPVITQD